MTATFEWDPAKRASNLAKHGVDFLRATEVFDGPILRSIDGRRAYGEERLEVIGMAGLELLTIICTIRGNCCRIISARRANRNEQSAYRQIRSEEA